MKTRNYWKIRKQLLKLIFNVKKIAFIIDNRRRSSKEYKSFNRLLYGRFVASVFQWVIIAIFFNVVDNTLLNSGVLFMFDNGILSSVIIGELGVAGVILGLYCSNISSVYSARYANAPEKVAIAFQYDKLTDKCLHGINGFIVYGTIILIEILMGINIGWISGCVLTMWSLLVVISFGIIGNRIYQLSDVFRISDDAFTILWRVITKNLNQDFFATDANYQNHFCKIVSEKMEVLKSIQKFGCSLNLANNSSLLSFMCKNLGVIEQYWLIKRNISKDSLWFRRKGKYQKWHFADYTEASMALRTGTSLRPKEEPDYYWLEDEIMSINHACVKYLIEKNDFGALYNYFAVFDSLCKSAISQKEANYYLGQIDWLNKEIQKTINEKKVSGDTAFAGIVEHISLLYLDIILETSKYYQDLDVNGICKSVVEGIDTGKSYNFIKAIRGRDYIETYKKVLLEVHVEGRRITPDWLVRQYVAKEEYVYVNSLFDIVKESIEHAYSLSTVFIEKKMYYEACILLTRFYEYESKLLNFYKYAKQIETNLKQHHVDSEEKWNESRLIRIEETFAKYKKELPELLLKSSSTFAIKNWDRREEYPDFLGECYNHIAEDTIEAIVKSDKVQFERNFDNLSRIMLLYQEYIRTDFIKNKDLYRVEYAYYMFTSPIMEWAQIGGLGILWGEFFKDAEWSSIVKKATRVILKGKEGEQKPTELAELLIEYVSKRDEFMMGTGSRGVLETRWNQYVANAIRESANIETENVMFGQRVKTDSKIINAFCSDFLDMGFITNPSEIFWVLCVNPLLSEEKKFQTKFSWEDDIDE